MFLNKFRIPTGTSYKGHLAMALKILETPPDVEGVIVECGSWQGGSSANLSLICKQPGSYSFTILFKACPRLNQSTGKNTGRANIAVPS